MGHIVSYWLESSGPEPDGVAQLRGDRTADVAVIGGGYTGLSAAYHLATVHSLQTVVLEAERVGWGASGRNGGFAMMGMGKLSLGDRIKAWGFEAARRSLAISAESVELVSQIIQKESIECDVQPRGHLRVAHRAARVALLHEHQALYLRLGYTDVEFLDRAALASRRLLGGPSAHGALRVGGAFGLHPLSYTRGLAVAARRRGAEVCDRSPVVGWSSSGGWHALSTPGGTVRARRVIVATNGYTGDRLHPSLAGRTLAAASNIVVTRPLTAMEWEATGMGSTQLMSDTRALLYYWRRLPDGRLLFGGRGGLVDTPLDLARRRVSLERAIGEKFPELRGITSDFFWSGNVCLPYDRTPHVHEVDGDRTIVYALGYTGTGVALATYCGAVAADLVAGRDVRRDTPLTAIPLPRFPLPALRRVYLGAAYAAYAAKDRWL